MSRPNAPRSLVAERAVRLMRGEPTGWSSKRLIRELLATRVSDESAAKDLLETAFGGDGRLQYSGGAWQLSEALDDVTSHGKTDSQRAPNGQPRSAPAMEEDRALIMLGGGRDDQGRWQLQTVSLLRFQSEEIVTACGGAVSDDPMGRRLRRTVRDALRGAIPVLHDPPGSLLAFERWLGESIEVPISLRNLARRRLELPAHHTHEDLLAALDLPWRETDDPLEQADSLDACLQALRRPGERLNDLRGDPDAAPPIDWSQFAFDPSWIEQLPPSAGNYRFFDKAGELVYVGKAKNLSQRLRSYFREGTPRTERVQRLLDSLYRIEIEETGSELEALLREAEQIRQGVPSANVQREIHPSKRGSRRTRSILILEPADDGAVLHTYLIFQSRLIGRVRVGPRGGGLAKIERLLDQYFFQLHADGPVELPGPDVDVELIVRWLGANRDRVVAFDPTDLKTAREVIERLRWFVQHGGPQDEDGSPIHTR